MKKLIENITGGYSSSASVIDGSLIISLPDAISPVVWRMDLKKIEASSLEVRDNKDGTFVLTFKTDKGQQEDVAPFDSRSKAVKALMVVSAAMHRSSGTYSAVNDSTKPVTTNDSGSGNKWAGTLAGIVILIALVYVLMNMSPSQPISMEGADTQSSAFSSSDTNQGTGNRTGVPQSAEDFLMGR